VQRTVERLDLGEAVHFVSGVSDERIVELYAEAEVAVVPSLYEGFSLPAVEAMATEVALLATTGGAIPEVVGTDGTTAALVPPVTQAPSPPPSWSCWPTRSGVPASVLLVGSGWPALQLVRSRGGHRGPVPGGDRPPRPDPGHERLRPRPGDHRRRCGRRAVLTVRYDRLGLRPGDRLLDLGCGGGRHAFEAARLGAGSRAPTSTSSSSRTCTSCSRRWRRR
jgi:hypothetical protein